MIIQKLGNNFDKKLFNAIATHPLQTWDWGEARKEMGIDILRLGEYEEDILKNTFQITFHPIPHTKFKIGYLPKSSIPSKEVITLFRRIRKTKQCYFL